MGKRSPRNGSPILTLTLWRSSCQETFRLVRSVSLPRPIARLRRPARLSPSLLSIAGSLIFSALHTGVVAITSALPWVIFVGNALVSLLMLWDSLQPASRSWLSIFGSGVMLLIAVLTPLAYGVVLLSTGWHSSWFPLLLPLASSALIAGVYILTASPRVLTWRQRTLFTTLLVLTGANLLGLFLAEVWGW